MGTPTMPAKGVMRARARGMLDELRAMMQAAARQLQTKKKRQRSHREQEHRRTIISRSCARTTRKAKKTLRQLKPSGKKVQTSESALSSDRRDHIIPI